MNHTPYDELPSTKAMRALPRFGHSNNFALLFASSDEATDYVVGLLFAGILVISFFVAWWVVLVILKCIGKKRVGFMSGHAFQVQDDKKKRPLMVRSVFVSAAIILIVFSVLFVTQGLTNLKNTVITVRDNANAVEQIIYEANQITAALRSVGAVASSTRDTVVANLTEFCPSQPNLDQETGTDFSGMIADAVTLLTQLANFVDTDLKDVQTGLDDVNNAAVDVEDQADNIEVGDWQSLVILIPFTVIPTILIIGVIMAWRNTNIIWYQHMLSWVALPLFIIMTVFAIAFSSGIVIAASANADFCSGGQDRSPDNTIEAILDYQGYSTEDMAYRAAVYYIRQCVAEDPFAFLRSYQDELAAAASSVQDLIAEMKAAGIAQLTALCGEDINTVYTLLETAKDNIRVLISSAHQALDLLACDNIVPIYTSTFYGGTCDYSVTGVTWSFASFLVVGFMGTMMIMFRSSWLPNAEIVEKFESEPIDFVDEVEYDQQMMAEPSAIAEEEYGLRDNEDNSLDDDMIYTSAPEAHPDDADADSVMTPDYGKIYKDNVF